MKNDILDCGLPLTIQKLYIKRLKHMIERWEFDNFCGHCPIHRNFAECTARIKQFHKYLNPWGQQVCQFCRQNVKLGYGCPCIKLGPQEALKRAKDFILRFEKKYEL